ncbi:MEDS domain-containing protein [Cytobacillus gottheilii]|uniref:MEDS domain-containing protein n=1 Tax=Cytobacillus gottheilii TaxID=859144 RepID=UPI001594D985|nr:ATP-binding protein [Cytobacillus gottheilii]
MDRKTAFLTEEIEIKNKAHILYTYHSEENYVNNAVSYIMTGIANDHHVILIENEYFSKKIQRKLKAVLAEEDLKKVHFTSNYDFYLANNHFHIDRIVQCFGEVLDPLMTQNISVRTWAHVEWPEEANIDQTLIDFEQCADHEINQHGIISVCAYDGKRISASLQNKIMEWHEYFMTDDALVRSYLYRGNDAIFPSLSDQVLRDKKVEKQLSAKNDQMQAFMKQNLDSVMIVGQNETVLYINHIFEETFGWSADEILGLNVYELPVAASVSKEKIDHREQTIKESDSIYKMECTRQTKDGKHIKVLQTCFPFRDEDDQIFAWVVILRDQTERYQAQDLLLQSDKLSIAGELAAGIAHEIRNPVTAIKGFLQLLNADGKNVRTYYSVMASEIERIELILSELLVLAKPQSTDFKSNNLVVLIKDVITLLDAQANMNSVQIKTICTNEEIHVKCDVNQIKQICINFIKNGIEAMDSGGILTVKIEQTINEILLSFIDEGKGIPESILKKLGQPFFTTKENGTGLGLMVSKKIIEDHYGSLQIHSQLHEGTTIEVRLPIR